MTITIEPPDEAAARVRTAAAARGQDLGTFATAAVLETGKLEPIMQQPKPLPIDKFFKAMTLGADPNRAPLSDHSVSRENMDEDRG